PFMLAAWPGARRLRIRTRLAAVLTAGVLMLPVGLVLGDALSNPEGSGHFTYHPLPGYSVWENRLSSLGYNLLFFLDNRKWPLALTILALVGLVSGAARPVGGAWLPLWVAAMTGLFTVVHYGDFSAVHAAHAWRFAHHTFLPLTLLALAGLAWLWGRGRAGQGAALILTAWALAAPWAQSAFLHQRHFLAELWDASAEVARRLPPEALVAVETADYFCLFAYGRGLQAVVGPLPRPPRGPFYVFAQARSLGSIWDNLALVPVEYWKGRRDYLLLRAPGPAPGRRG
ncbi:MAG TPA: hypothetical protein VNO81_12795, partial [Candidatus Nitrosotenuis sp.]|nr:hypothetical protein [Candidatus Nitrosotenuis sp.]